MTESFALSANSLIGLPLETARAMLAVKGVSEDQITVIETLPPRAERAMGDWRVLRCRLHVQDGNARYEITTAREQCVESHTPGRATPPTAAPPGG